MESIFSLFNGQRSKKLIQPPTGNEWLYKASQESNTSFQNSNQLLFQASSILHNQAGAEAGTWARTRCQNPPQPTIQCPVLPSTHDHLCLMSALISDQTWPHIEVIIKVEIWNIQYIFPVHSCNSCTPIADCVERPRSWPCSLPHVAHLVSLVQLLHSTLCKRLSPRFQRQLALSPQGSEHFRGFQSSKSQTFCLGKLDIFV